VLVDGKVGEKGLRHLVPQNEALRDDQRDERNPADQYDKHGSSSDHRVARLDQAERPLQPVGRPAI
jgi:hypothetical protein